MKKSDESLGFTLVELIIVIAIIAILAGAIFVAIDPARRLNETRNTRRNSDIATILDAIKKYQADNGGVHYSTVSNMTENIYYQIGTASSSCGISCGSPSTSGNCVNLEDIGSNYLADLPLDPKEGTTQETGYAISRDSNQAITVVACYAEGEGAGGAGAIPEIIITR